MEVWCISGAAWFLVATVVESGVEEVLMVVPGVEVVLVVVVFGVEEVVVLVALGWLKTATLLEAVEYYC